MSGVGAAAPSSDIGQPVTTIVTHLEMTTPPATPPRRPPRPGLEVRLARRPTVDFYRYLYATVGEPWTWVVRRWLSDAELAAILGDPRVEVNVLWIEGVPAGFAELDRRTPADVELAYFGLMPAFIGQGLGGYLLDWALHHAWRSGPRRLWLHTCDLDHPGALALYQRLGFRIYDRRTEEVYLPPGVREPVRTAASA